jgi:Glycosyltransferase 61
MSQDSAARAELQRGMQIVHETPLQPRTPAPVVVHTRTGGEALHRRFLVHRPVHFDSVVTVVSDGVIAGLVNSRRGTRPLRDVARSTYFAAMGLRASVSAPLRTGRPLMDTRAVEPNNMAHLLLEVIPCVLHARKVLGQPVDVLTRNMQPPFVRLLEAFGIARIDTWRQVHAPLVTVRGTRGLSVYDLMGHPHCPASVTIPEPFDDLEFESTAGFERVFLARRGLRALANHAEVEALTQAHGYRTVFMEDYSLPDQIMIGKRARHVVAIHGAAMAFLALNQHLESVIELSPSHVYHEMFPMCIGQPARDYHFVISQFDPLVGHRGWASVAHHKSLAVSTDVDLLTQAIETVHQTPQREGTTS